MLISHFVWVENVTGKGENTNYQYFLLFPQCLQKSNLTGSLKVRCVVKIQIFYLIYNILQGQKERDQNAQSMQSDLRFSISTLHRHSG